MEVGSELEIGQGGFEGMDGVKVREVVRDRFAMVLRWEPADSMCEVIFDIPIEVIIRFTGRAVATWFTSAISPA